MTFVLMHPGGQSYYYHCRSEKILYTILSDVIYSDQCLLNNALINASETSLVGILSLISANAFCRMERNKTKGLNRIF